MKRIERRRKGRGEKEENKRRRKGREEKEDNKNKKEGERREWRE